MVSIRYIGQSLSLFRLALSAAPVQTNSPDATYVANFTSRVEGSISFSATNGSVLVDVNLSNLPSSGGPFLYHIHQLPVPSDGNCTGTAGHLNPYNGSEAATSPADKEVGDLSGKHGRINGQSLQTSYIDEYLSLNDNDPAFIGNLSVVVHYANTTRIACANITEMFANSSQPSTSSASQGQFSVSSAGGGAGTFNSGFLMVVGAFFGELGLLI